jgi:hypothetical protein
VCLALDPVYIPCFGQCSGAMLFTQTRLLRQFWSLLAGPDAHATIPTSADVAYQPSYVEDASVWGLILRNSRCLVLYITQWTLGVCSTPLATITRDCEHVRSEGHQFHCSSGSNSVNIIPSLSAFGNSIFNTYMVLTETDAFAGENFVLGACRPPPKLPNGGRAGRSYLSPG